MPLDVMKPKELLITRLQEHIVPFMEERGFRFSKSRVHFTRKVGQVCQNIVLCSDRYNTADNCTFWTMWSANAPEYLEWYRKQWSDEKPSGDTLGDLADWNIPGWSRGPAGPRYTLTNTAEDAAVSASFRSDIEDAGLYCGDREQPPSALLQRPCQEGRYGCRRLRVDDGLALS